MLLSLSLLLLLLAMTSERVSSHQCLQVEVSADVFHPSYDRLVDSNMIGTYSLSSDLVNDRSFYDHQIHSEFMIVFDAESPETWNIYDEDTGFFLVMMGATYEVKDFPYSFPEYEYSCYFVKESGRGYEGGWW